MLPAPGGDTYEFQSSMLHLVPDGLRACSESACDCSEDMLAMYKHAMAGLSSSSGVVMAGRQRDVFLL